MGYARSTWANFVSEHIRSPAYSSLPLPKLTLAQLSGELSRRLKGNGLVGVGVKPAFSVRVVGNREARGAIGCGALVILTLTRPRVTLRKRCIFMRHIVALCQVQARFHNLENP